MIGNFLIAYFDYSKCRNIMFNINTVAMIIYVIVNSILCIHF